VRKKKEKIKNGVYRVEYFLSKEKLTQKQIDFYEATKNCKIVQEIKLPNKKPVGKKLELILKDPLFEDIPYSY